MIENDIWLNYNITTVIMKNNSESREEFIETIKGMFVPFTGYYEKKYYDIQLPD